VKGASIFKITYLTDIFLLIYGKGPNHSWQMGFAHTYKGTYGTFWLRKSRKSSKLLLLQPPFSLPVNHNVGK
jgi:hypothetical protein